MNELPNDRIIQICARLTWECCVKSYLGGMVAGMLLMWAIL